MTGSHVETAETADELDMLKAERDRYRQALERIADAEYAESAEPLSWAVEMHDEARNALGLEDL